MFISDERVLAVSIGAARARLANLVHGGWLGGASEAVYQHGLDHLLRVGPLGDLPGGSRLVRVQFLDPVDRDHSVRVGMRWEAIGVTGGLFPVLDADIGLTAEGDDGTRMTLTGVYRPPLAALGAGLDRVLLHSVATATIHSLMTNMARALEGAVPGADDAGAPAWWEIGWQRHPDRSTSLAGPGPARVVAPMNLAELPLTGKSHLYWARGSRPWPVRAVRACEAGEGGLRQAASAFGASVTSRPRASSWRTWLRILRCLSMWVS
jgi:hypothetical protein